MTSKKKSPSLNPQEIRELKNKLRRLKPTVVIDYIGLTNEVYQEVNCALNKYELIKIRNYTDDNKELAETAKALCARAKAVHIQTTGHIIAIYRKNPVVEGFY